jgi:xanthine dehydrogenase accessory factor
VAKVVGSPEVDCETRLGQALLVDHAGPYRCEVAEPGLASAMSVLATEMLTRGESGVRTLNGPAGNYRIYVESHLPRPVLLVVGAGHVGQRVAEAGVLAGFQVEVLDDRSAYANPARFPTASRVICGPFAAELAALNPGPRHHVVLMTRGHTQDRVCLHALAGTQVAYLGMIGSRSRVQAVLGQLRAEGVTDEWLERIRAPIGLDIGARAPGEIAIAVLAEVIAARRGGTGAPLSSLGRSLVHLVRG